MTTQMEYAIRGTASEEMRKVAKDEGLPVKRIVEGVRRGSIVVLDGKRGRGVRPLGIGEGLRVKINTNVGTSADLCDLDLELEKARVAARFGSDTVMDLSTGGDLDAIRQTILREVKLPLGTVPIYQAAIEAIRSGRSIVDMDEDDIFNTISKHAKDGVDFVTVHCGITRQTVENLRKHQRVTGVVSRGGAFLAAWMIHNGKENPLYSSYDRLLEIAHEYDLCLSLGDALRPGSLADASDRPQMEELMVVGELVERARKGGVQCMVEGPGHMPLNQIASNVNLEKTLCRGAPYYVLGPLVTDCGTPYDHISGAIGGAVAAMTGADYLCVVTPAEHLGLPSVEEVKEGVIASKLAAHACDITRLGERHSDVDLKMARARAKLDWETQMRLALDPERAKAIKERVRGSRRGCTMCGPYCTYELLSKYFGDKKATGEKCF